MIPAAPLTLRIALVAAFTLFALGAAQRFAGWRLPPFVVAILAASTLLPVAWRFLEFPAVMGLPGPWPALRVAFVLVPVVLSGCALGIAFPGRRAPILAAAMPLSSLVFLFHVRAAVLRGVPEGARPEDPRLWLMTGTMVLLASLGLLLAREASSAAGRPDTRAEMTVKSAPGSPHHDRA